jgi:predicted metalloprotease with PDZ domain
MRGVNLNVFDFDYDLTWAAVLMNADETIYGRFGGRDAANPDKYLTLTGLKQALRSALDAHRRHRTDKSVAKPVEEFRVEEFPAARRMKPGACIHCHQVYDFRREAKRAAGQWGLSDVWVYPLPENLGLIMDPNHGTCVRSVAPASEAERAGLKVGDVLHQVSGASIASFADVQYALHRAPEKGSLPLSWMRGKEIFSATLTLPEGWRRTDISWRASMWGLEPSPCVHGRDLTAEEKKGLGLAEKHLAFRQGKFVPSPARIAGIQEDDIILGIDHKSLDMTMLQFNAFVRLNYRTGDRIVFQVMRNGKPLDVPMTLPSRPF